jgi:hypothetical protein
MDPDSLAVYLNTLGELIKNDTVFASINDTLFYWGYAKGKTSNIPIRRWVINGESISSTPDQIHSVLFADSGLYRSYFIVTDKNGTSDTAGFYRLIKIVDDLPLISFAMDTLWSRVDQSVWVEFNARDLAGYLKQIRISYDSTPGFDTTLIRSDEQGVYVSYSGLQDQAVIIEVTDDDDNVVSDTLWIHFNSPPELELIHPVGDTLIDIRDLRDINPQWTASDSDNPEDLYFSIRIGKSRYLFEENTLDSLLRHTTYDQGLPDSLSGRIYWQILAYDGFDTVSKTDSFYLANLNVTTGTLQGTVLLDGLDSANGVRIWASTQTETDLLVYLTATAKDGSWSITDLEPGAYTIIYEDTLALDYDPQGRKYQPQQYTQIGVQIAKITQMDTLVMEDNSPPRIIPDYLMEQDTLRSQLKRTDTLSGIFLDTGSQVDPTSILALLNGNPIEGNFTQGSWQVFWEDASDGLYQLTLMAADGKGQNTTLTTYFVISLNPPSVTAGADTTVSIHDPIYLHATATGSGVSVISKVEWKCGSAAFVETTPSLNYTITAPASPSSDYSCTIRVTDNDGKVSEDNTRIMVVDNRAPVAIAVGDTTVSINDAVLLNASTQAFYSSIISYEWSIDGGILPWTVFADPAVTIPNVGSTAQTLICIFRVTVNNNGGLADSTKTITYDTTIVNVVLDRPQMTLASQSPDTTLNVGTALNLRASATDQFGSIQKYYWTCNNITDSTDTGIYTRVVPLATPINNPYLCRVYARDNDNQLSDTLHWSHTLSGDNPQVVAMPDTTLSIRDSIILNAQATPGSGTLTTYEWTILSGATTLVPWTTVPAIPTKIGVGNLARDLICIIRVTDNLGLQDIDTTIVSVVLDRPNPGTLVIDQSQVSIYDNINLSVNGASDGFGNIVEYIWSCEGPGGIGYLLGSSATPDTIFHAPLFVNDTTLYSCSVTVRDDDGLDSTSAVAQLNVLLDRPVITSIAADTTVSVNDTIRLYGSAADGYGTLVKYEWLINSTDPLDYIETSQIDTILIAPAAGIPSYTARLRVWDDDGLYSGTRVMTINVQQDPPTANFTLPDTISADSTISLNASLSSPGNFGTIISYEWSFDGGNTWPETGALVSVTAPSSEGDLNIRLRVTDDDNNTHILSRNTYINESWAFVGNEGFSGGDISYIATAFANNPDTIYMAYVQGNDVRVFKNNVDNPTPAWIEIGNLTPGGTPSYVSLVFSTTNIPYISYSVNGNIETYSFSGGSWIAVGTPFAGTQPNMTIDNSNRLILAYRDATSKITVRTSNGGAWSTFGTAAFSVNAIQNPSVTTTPDGSTIYVVFSDAYTSTAGTADDNSATVYRHNGGDWALLGTRGFSNDGYATRLASHPKIRLNSTGTPYVAYVDGLNNITVRAYSGSWNVIGTISYALSNVEYPDIHFIGDTPWVSFRTYKSFPIDVGDYAITFFNGVEWEYFGDENPAGGEVSWPVSTIAPDDDRIYTGYNLVGSGATLKGYK